MPGFFAREKGRLGKIGLGGVLVGTNAGLIYMAIELTTAYSGLQFAAMAGVILNTVAAAVLDFKKKNVDQQERYTDEDNV